jgi:hypothetical protein
MRRLATCGSIAALLIARGAPAAGADVHFKGLKSDPAICTGSGEEETCCGLVTAKGESRCRGPELLHPAMRPLATCLVETLAIQDNPEVCSSGLRETFRGRALQDGYKSIPGGWSFHNYGLAFDVCSYFKSGDCSEDNLVNKVVGGVTTWLKGGKVRCQAVYRKKGSGPSKDVVAKVLADPHYPSVLAKVKACYAKCRIPYGDSNWGVAWKDYFDAPHFQYFASASAGYYKKKKSETGPHVLVRILADCYAGDRKAMLEDLYATADPTEFIRSRREGCGAEANQLFDSYVAASYPGGFGPPVQ